MYRFGCLIKPSSILKRSFIPNNHPSIRPPIFNHRFCSTHDRISKLLDKTIIDFRQIENQFDQVNRLLELIPKPVELPEPTKRLNQDQLDYLLKIPDPNQEFPSASYVHAKRFNLLMKLVLMTKEFPEIYHYLIQNINQFKDQINQRNAEGCTALMLTPYNYKETTAETIQLLVKHGAYLDILDRDGNTVLMYAVFHASIDHVPMLITKMMVMVVEAGANLELRNNDGETALDLAKEHDRSEEIIELLTPKKTLIQTEDEIIQAEQESETIQAEPKPKELNMELIKPFLTKPDPDKVFECSPNTKSKGFTLLMKLVLLTEDNPEIEKWLEQNISLFKNQINQQNAKGWTALMLSALNIRTKSSEKTVELLIKTEAKLDLQNDNGETALMLVARFSGIYSTENTVKILLEAGADVHKCNKYDDMALKLAAQYSSSESTEGTIKMLLKHGANPDIRGYSRDTALIVAAGQVNRSSSCETIKTLIDYKADPNKCNSDGLTALMIVAADTRDNQNVPARDAVKLLIEAGTDPDIKTSLGENALMLAIMYSSNGNLSAETMKRLIEAGTNLDAVNIYDRTVRRMCVLHNSPPEIKEIIELLQKKNNLTEGETIQAEQQPSEQQPSEQQPLISPNLRQVLYHIISCIFSFFISAAVVIMMVFGVIVLVIMWEFR